MAKKKSARIGRYRILGELGRGAMGIVYRAEDPNLDRIVALKTIILSDDAEGRKDYHKRFFLEAKAAGKLTHPHIVTTYDFGEEGDLAYLAMELLEGTDLRERLLKAPLPTADAVDIAYQVADGLAFAHERGVVHRDVKPGNIMLLARGQVKIMDFGIARMRSDDFKTSTGIVLGTPRFMSPEQVAGSPVDQRSDLFSLGAVLYEMLTRAPLFSAEDTPQIAHNVTHLEHVPPSHANPEVTPMLDFVVARALKKDPAVRYQDATEMAADLRSCLAELRSREAAGGKDRDQVTKTVKLESTNDKAPQAPAARAIVSDTRLPLSRQFDSSAGLQRVAAKGGRDRERLARAPLAALFGSRTSTITPTVTAAVMAASTSKVAAYPSPPIRNPAIMGPAASPTSQIVPNTPMAAPRRRAEARSAISALVTGVTAPTPRPSSGATSTNADTLSLRKMSGSAIAQSRRPITMTGIRPTRSDTRPVIGLATMATTSCAPRTIAISASLSPTCLA